MANATDILKRLGVFLGKTPEAEATPAATPATPVEVQGEETLESVQAALVEANKTIVAAEAARVTAEATGFTDAAIRNGHISPAARDDVVGILVEVSDNQELLEKVKAQIIARPPHELTANIAAQAAATGKGVAATGKENFQSEVDKLMQMTDLGRATAQAGTN